MANLFDYQQQVQTLLGFDERQELFNIDDLTTFINTARRQVCAQGECLRWLTPAGGAIESIEVTSAGSGYTNPIVSITPPDAPTGQLPFPNGLQALGTASQIGGQITNVSVSNGGDGYFSPTATITDPSPAAHGALLKISTVSSVNRALPGQEIYAFKDIDLGPNPGVDQILSVRAITIIWDTYQYALRGLSTSKYMRSIRLYSRGFQSQPAFYCQYGQGINGTVRIFPVPDQPYAMQWDCLCTPQPLQDEESFDAIPQPWTDAVAYYATYLAILSLSLRRPNIAPLADRFYNPKDGGLYGDMMRRSRSFVQPQQSSPVGRWSR